MKRDLRQVVKVGRWLLLTICIGLIVMYSANLNTKAVASASPRQVTPYGLETSPILSAIAVPENRAYYWTSGTVPPVTNSDAPAGTRDRYGDTKTQAVGILERIQALLDEAELTLSDVIYLRVYLVADPAMERVDYQGWFDAYAQFFNNEANPTKVARSTVAVAGLVDPGWLIEIEAVAVYSKDRRL